MPRYEWTCGECGAKLQGWGPYDPGPTRQNCQDRIATSPDDEYSPLLSSMRCLFKDPVLVETQKRNPNGS